MAKNKTAAVAAKKSAPAKKAAADAKKSAAAAAKKSAAAAANKSDSIPGDVVMRNQADLYKEVAKKMAGSSADEIQVAFEQCRYGLKTVDQI